MKTAGGVQAIEQSSVHCSVGELHYKHLTLELRPCVTLQQLAADFTDYKIETNSSHSSFLCQVWSQLQFTRYL